MSSEYDPVFTARGEDDLAAVRDVFAGAAAPFLRTPWSWFAWALLLPAISLLTPGIHSARGPFAVVLGWSVTILIGGVVEGWLVRDRGAAPRTTLAGWVLRGQANLSLVAAALSAALAWAGELALVPAVWLLILGHSFLVLGGLAFRPFRRTGWIYQLGGLAALWPGQDGLLWFAIATGLGNLATAWAIRRHRLQAD